VPAILVAFDGSPPARAAVERTAVLFPDAEAVVVAVASGLEELEDAVPATRIALSDDLIRTAVARLRERRSRRRANRPPRAHRWPLTPVSVRAPRPSERVAARGAHS
jgi:hypothetical protein